MYVHMYVKYACIHVSAYIYVDVNLYVYVYVFAYVYVYVSVHTRPMPGLCPRCMRRSCAQAVSTRPAKPRSCIQDGAPQL